MAYTCRISDGSTTLNLIDSANYDVPENGIDFPPPRLKTAFGAESMARDGSVPQRSRFENRVITVRLNIFDSTMTNFRTNVRAIQRVLNDARIRQQAGYGTKYYLEVLLDGTSGPVFFDILEGELIMPRTYFSSILGKNFGVYPATLRLVCEPFGRGANVNIAQDTLENHDYDTDHNYKDITTAEAYGDVPARLYIKLAQSAAAGTKKIWVAKRSGARYDDDLFIQGEDESSSTQITAQGTVTFSDAVVAALSGGKCRRASWDDATGGEVVFRHDFDIATPPRGWFRVLAYVRVDVHTAAHYARFQWGVGYSYGDKSATPSHYVSPTADSTFEILDLGMIQIPPVAESEIAGNSTYTLRIYGYLSESSTAVVANIWDLDYVFLLPVDEGHCIINDVASDDVVVIDGISDPTGVFFVDGSDKIENTPDYVEGPFTLGREITRIYVLRDDDKDMTFTVDLKYQPQFLVI